MGTRDHGDKRSWGQEIMGNRMKGGEVPPCLCSLALVFRAADAAAHLCEFHPAPGAVERDRRILHRRRVIAGCAVAARERILALRADQH